MTDRQIRSWLTDMDGVLVHEGTALPGAAEFVGGAARGAAPVPGPDEQLHLHPARPAGPARGRRAGGAGGGDLDLGAGHRDVPGGAAAGRLGLRDRRGGADHRAARGRVHAHRHRPGLRRARRDAHVLVRGADQGDPADPGRGEVHRDQPRRVRAQRRRRRAGDRRGRRDDQRRERAQAVLRRQAEPDDVPLRPQPDRGALGDHGDGRRPDGHRHRRRHGGGPADVPGALRLDQARATWAATRSTPAAWRTRSPTSWSWSGGERRGRAPAGRARGGRRAGPATAPEALTRLDAPAARRVGDARRAAAWWASCTPGRSRGTACSPATWLVGYLAFSAGALLLKARGRARYRRPALVYGAAAVVLGAALLAVRPTLRVVGRGLRPAAGRGAGRRVAAGRALVAGTARPR